MTEAAFRPRGRVAVVPLFYGRSEVAAACLQSLERARARRDFDIFAIENPSRHSGPARELIRRAMAKGQVAGAYFPANNAAFNSMLCALHDDLFKIRGNYDYVVLSDGDIEVPKYFVDEEVQLLDQHPNIASVALRLDISSWHPEARGFDAAVQYAAAVVKAERDGRPFVEYGSGLWMRMFRAQELDAALSCFVRNGIRFRDGQIDRYFQIYGRIPSCTIRARGHDLRRGHLFVSEPDQGGAESPSFVWQEPFQSIWNNDIQPGGALERPDGVIAVGADSAALAVACSPEEPTEFTDAPALRDCRKEDFQTGVVVNELDPDTAYTGVVLTLSRQLKRMFLSGGGDYIVIPVAIAAQMRTSAPMLRSVSWVAQEGHCSPKQVQRIMSAAARLTATSGELVVETVDWRRTGAHVARATTRLERAALLRRIGLPAKLRIRRARETAESARPSLPDLAELLLAGAREGWALSRIERSPARADRVRYVLSRGAPVSWLDRAASWIKGGQRAERA